MEYDAAAIEVLAPVIEAARTALRKLDKDDVPARLRQVAGSGARRLPPPMATSLLEALDEDEWLRSKAARQAKDSALAAWFLERKDGWESVIGEEIEAVRARMTERAAEAQEREVASREAKTAAEAEKAADLRRQLAKLRQEAAGEGRRRAAAIADAVATHRADNAQARQEVTKAQDALADVEERAARLERQLERTKADLLTALRSAPTDAGDAGGSAWAGDGRSLARHADEVFAAARARLEAPPETIEPAEPQDPGAPGPPLPKGIAPDAPEAVDAVLAWSGTVLIDGYNLAGTLGADLNEPGAARAEVWTVVNRLARGAGDVVVVWDSSFGSDARTGEVFVPDADEELRRRARLDPAGVVVVSNDREVIDGVTAAGSVAIWSTAVADWCSRR